MKKVILLVSLCIFFSSCCTLFCSSKQSITFMGPNGIQIYDASNNLQLAEIKQDNSITIKIKKSRGDKQLLAKKNGYQTTPILLESTFNNACIWNIIFFPGFLVDYWTQRMNEWNNAVVQIELDEKTSQEE